VFVALRLRLAGRLWVAGEQACRHGTDAFDENLAVGLALIDACVFEDCSDITDPSGRRLLTRQVLQGRDGPFPSLPAK
jgi:hypothetical protein